MRLPILNRRSLIGGAAVAGLAASRTGAAPDARPSQASGPPWHAALEGPDWWLDRPGTRHRMAVDASMGPDAAMAMMTAAKYYFSNQKGYELEPAALGVLVVLRHRATPFGFNDAMWKKYSRYFIERTELEGNDAVRARTQNPRWRSDNPNDADAATLANLAAKGAMFPICAISTHGTAQEIAQAEKLDAAVVEAELSANTIPNGRLMASGILALSRAQELGYSLVPTR